MEFLLLYIRRCKLQSAPIWHPMRQESRAYGEKGNADDANGGTEERPVLVELDLNRSELSSRSALAFARSGREQFHYCWIQTLQTVLDYSVDHYTSTTKTNIYSHT